MKFITLLLILISISTSLSLKRSKKWIHFANSLYFLEDGYDTVHETRKLNGIQYKAYDKDAIILVLEGKKVPKELEPYVAQDQFKPFAYRLPYYFIKEIMSQDGGRDVKNLHLLIQNGKQVSKLVIYLPSKERKTIIDDIKSLFNTTKNLLSCYMDHFELVVQASQSVKNRNLKLNTLYFLWKKARWSRGIITEVLFNVKWYFPYDIKNMIDSYPRFYKKFSNKDEIWKDKIEQGLIINENGKNDYVIFYFDYSKGKSVIIDDGILLTGQAAVHDILFYLKRLLPKNQIERFWKLYNNKEYEKIEDELHLFGAFENKEIKWIYNI